MSKWFIVSELILNYNRSDSLICDIGNRRSKTLNKVKKQPTRGPTLGRINAVSTLTLSETSISLLSCNLQWGVPSHFNENYECPVPSEMSR